MSHLRKRNQARLVRVFPRKTKATPSDEKWAPAPEWRGFQRRWARPAIIHAREER